jgi:hypothetical protein
LAGFAVIIYGRFWVITEGEVPLGYMFSGPALHTPAVRGPVPGWETAIMLASTAVVVR